MVREIIAQGESTNKQFSVVEFTSITIYVHGGTGNFSLKIGVDGQAGNLIEKATPAADTITQIAEDAIVLDVTTNTGGSYDIVGELR